MQFCDSSSCHFQSHNFPHRLHFAIFKYPSFDSMSLLFLLGHCFDFFCFFYSGIVLTGAAHWQQAEAVCSVKWPLGTHLFFVNIYICQYHAYICQYHSYICQYTSLYISGTVFSSSSHRLVFPLFTARRSFGHPLSFSGSADHLHGQSLPQINLAI